MAKLESDLAIKTGAHIMSVEQYEIVLNQHDNIAKDNREMYAKINANINSYKESRGLNTQPELLPCDPSLFTRDNEDA